MKGIYIFIALLFLCSVLYAQTEDWLWATQAGGTDYDYGRAITIDSSGNSYVTGYFNGTATFGTTSLVSS